MQKTKSLARFVLPILLVVGFLFSNTGTASAATNIFSDGFESGGNLTGWTADSKWNEISTTILAPVHTGLRAARAEGNTGITPDYLTKNISTVGYTNVTFSYWYKVTGLLGPAAHFRTQWSPDGTTWYDLAHYTNAALTNWKQETFTLPASANNNPNVKIRFQADFNTLLNAVRVDDITLDGDPIPTCSTNTFDGTFDGFALGSVNGQGGWAVGPLYDQSVVDNVFGYSTFGCKSLRFSDSVTSGSFGDQTFSFSIANEAGEAGAENGGMSGGTRQNHFEASFDIASTMPTLQPGMHISVSPDRGDGARMSYLRFEDQTDGIHVFFDDYTNGDFNESDITTLDRTAPHTIKFVMDFVNGHSNDIVKIYIDGNLEATGTSWEEYFVENESNPTRTVDSLLFRESGNANAGNAGNGFLVDNVSIESSTVPGAIEITKYACPEGTSVLRSVNGVGLTVPEGCTPQSGKTFGYVHGIQIDANGPYPELSAPITAAGATDANGVLTINNLPADGRYLVMETNGDNQQLPANEVLGLYCIGDGDQSNTNDNQELTFVPANGVVKCVAYNKIVDTTAPELPVHISPADNTVTTTALQTLIDWTDVTDPSSPVTYVYQSSTSPDTNLDGSFVSPAYTSGALTSSEIPTPGTPEGIYYWHVKACDALNNCSNWTTPWKITIDNTPEPTNGHVHIYKFIDGELATPVSANNASFPMFTATYNAPFTLDADGWTNGDAPYEASTSEMTAGAPYTANEDTSTSLVGTSCENENHPTYELVGYTSGTSYEAAAEGAPSLTVPEFTTNGEQYLIVWNHKCGEVLGASTLKVHIYKYLAEGEYVAQVADDSGAPSFPMTATWSAENIGSGTAGYVLGNNHGGTELKYAADTSAMSQGSDYTTSEIADGDVVVANAEACSEGKYYLKGYKSSLVGLEDAEEATLSETAPSFTDLQDDAYIIVVNQKCTDDLPPPPDTCDANAEVILDGTGSFELGTEPGVFATLNAGDTSIEGWTIGQEGIDYIGTYWTASDGSRSIDLNAFAAGSISKTFSTEVGESYTVTFDLSGNPENNEEWSSPSLKDVLVSADADGAESEHFTYDTATEGNSTSDMKWAQHTYTFTATSTETTITFASQIAGAFGPAIDNVSVKANCPDQPEMGHLIIKKTTNLEVTDELFSFSLSGDATDGFTLPSGGSKDEEIPAGEYTITELTDGLGNGWDLDSISCVYPESEESVGQITENKEGEVVDLEAGETVTCTFHNVYTTPSDDTPNVADVSLTKTVNAETAHVDDSVIYTLTATNNGPKDAVNVVVTDLLPTNLTYVSDDSSGAYVPGTGVWTIGSLANGVSTIIHITATVNNVESETVVTNTATITSGSENQEDPSDTNGENNSDSASVTVNTSGNDNEEQKDVCPNIDGNQSEIPKGKHKEKGECVNDSSGGGSSGSIPKTSSSALKGQVLGASTDICTAVDSFMKLGYKKNDPEQVKLLQDFLNSYMKSNLVVDGIFGKKTYAAVREFQWARKENVLTPWGFKKPTGQFYKTSLAEAKRLMCPDQFGTLPIPTDLTPWIN